MTLCLGFEANHSLLHSYLTFCWTNTFISSQASLLDSSAYSLPFLCSCFSCDASSMWNAFFLLLLIHIWAWICVVSISSQSSLITPFSEFPLNRRSTPNRWDLNSSLIISCSKMLSFGKVYKLLEDRVHVFYFFWISLQCPGEHWACSHYSKCPEMHE